MGAGLGHSFGAGGSSNPPHGSQPVAFGVNGFAASSAPAFASTSTAGVDQGGGGVLLAVGAPAVAVDAQQQLQLDLAAFRATAFVRGQVNEKHAVVSG